MWLQTLDRNGSLGETPFSLLVYVSKQIAQVLSSSFCSSMIAVADDVLLVWRLNRPTTTSSDYCLER